MHSADFHVSQIQVGTYISSTSYCCWHFHLIFKKKKHFIKVFFLQKENSCNTFLFHPGLSHAGCAIHHWLCFTGWPWFTPKPKAAKRSCAFRLKTQGFRISGNFGFQRRKVKCSNFPPALLLPVSGPLEFLRHFGHYLFTTTIKPISNYQIG